MKNDDVRDHQLITIQTECREQLLAQLKANGLDPFTFYAWALARDIEAKASKNGESVEDALLDELDCRIDDARSYERDLMAEVRDQLRQLGYSIEDATIESYL